MPQPLSAEELRFIKIAIVYWPTYTRTDTVILQVQEQALRVLIDTKNVGGSARNVCIVAKYHNTCGWQESGDIGRPVKPRGGIAECELRGPIQPMKDDDAQRGVRYRLL